MIRIIRVMNNNKKVDYSTTTTTNNIFNKFSLFI